VEFFTKDARWRHWLPGERAEGSRHAFEGLTAR